MKKNSYKLSLESHTVITKKSAFIKQIAFYLNNEDYIQAYDLSKAFASAFDSEVISHISWPKRLSGQSISKKPNSRAGRRST